jgi:hypothetical protein
MSFSPLSGRIVGLDLETAPGSYVMGRPWL